MLRALWEGRLPKGEARVAAQIAAIFAAKRTPESLPMCHPLRLDKVEIEMALEDGQIRIRALTRAHDRTGVEMEALTAASIAALTLYDWAKASDPAMEVTVRLVWKAGGKSGKWENAMATPKGQEHAIFGLPGNPVAVVVGLMNFVLPYLAALEGEAEPLPRYLTACLSTPVRKKETRAQFLTTRLSIDETGSLLAEPTPMQGSALLGSLAQADAFLYLPSNVGDYPAGTRVKVLPITSGWEAAP